MTKQKRSYEDGTALRNGTALLLESLKTSSREKDSQLLCGASRPQLSHVDTSSSCPSRRATSEGRFRGFSGMSYGVQFYGTPAFVASDEYSALLQRIRSKRMHALNGNVRVQTLLPARDHVCAGIYLGGGCTYWAKQPPDGMLRTRSLLSMAYCYAFFASILFVPDSIRGYRRECEAARANREMHSLNGNVDGNHVSLTPQNTPEGNVLTAPEPIVEQYAGRANVSADEQKYVMGSFEIASEANVSPYEAIAWERRNPLPHTNTRSSRQVMLRLFSNVLPPHMLHITHTLNTAPAGTGRSTMSYLEYLALERNRMMHAQNGNIRKSAKLASTKKIKKSKKKKSTNKPGRRAARNAQLSKQVSFLRAAQAEGNEGAKQLGPVIKGRGDYANIGESLGSKVGAFIGGKLHGFISKIFGSGDYEVAAPSAGVQNNSFLANDSTPQFENSHDGAITITFSEYLGYVPVTTDFTVQTFELDVTNKVTFPWLSTIAKNFQQYEFLGVMILVRSNMSPLTTSATMGTNFGSVRYDVDSLVPTNKVEIMNSLFSANGRASADLVFPVECNPDQTIIWPLKIRQPGESHGDEQLYSMGKFDCASEGAPVTAAKGKEVLIMYKVRMLKPRLLTGNGNPMFGMDLKGTSNTEPFDPIANTARVSQPRVNTIGASVSKGGVITFPYDTEPGSCYLVTWEFPDTGGSPGLTPTLGAYNFTALATFAYNQAASMTTSFSVIEYSGVNFSRIHRFAVKILPGGTLASPPSLKLAYGGNYVSGSGLLTIIEVDRRMCSGLTAESSTIVSRNEFIDFLIASDAGEECKLKHVNFNSTRLIDYVDAFRREQYVDMTMVPRCDEPYDVGVSGALDRLAIFGKQKPKPQVDPSPDEERNVCDDEDYYPVVEPAAKTRASNACKRLNGAQGEYTGTDDVKDKDGCDIPETAVVEQSAEYIPQLLRAISDFEVDYSAGSRVQVNPVGLCGTIDTLHSAAKARQKKGWANPACAMLIHSDRVFVWDSPPTLLKKRLLGNAPKGIWTVDKVRKVQCQCMLGVTCMHEINSCPGYASLLKDVLQANIDEMALSCHFDTGSDECTTLNGNNGEVTNTDDVQPSEPTKHHPCGAKDCKALRHYHKKAQKDAPASDKVAKHMKNAAEKRIALRNQLILCRKVTGEPNPLIDGTCPFGLHYHAAKRQDDNKDPMDQIEKLVEQKATGREISKALNRLKPLPPSGDDDVHEAKNEKDGKEVKEAAPIIDRESEVGVLNIFPRKIVIPPAPVALRAPLEAPAMFVRAKPPAPDRQAPRRPVIAQAPPVEPRPPVQQNRAQPRNERVHQNPPQRRVDRAPAQQLRVQPVPIRPPPPPQPPAQNVAVPIRPPPPPQPLVQNVAAHPPVQLAVAQAPAAPEDPLPGILLSMESRAQTLWLTRNLTSQLDENLILSRLVTDANRFELFKHTEDVTGTINAVCERAKRHVLETRLRHCKVRQVNRKKGLLRYVRWFRQNWNQMFYQSEIDELATETSAAHYAKVELTDSEVVVLTSFAILGVGIGIYCAWRTYSAIRGAYRSTIHGIGEVTDAVQGGAQKIVRPINSITNYVVRQAGEKVTRIMGANALDILQPYLPMDQMPPLDSIVDDVYKALPPGAHEMLNRDDMRRNIGSSARVAGVGYWIVSGFMAPIYEEWVKRVIGCGIGDMVRSKERMAERAKQRWWVNALGSHWCFNALGGLCFGLFENRTNGYIMNRFCVRPLFHALMAAVPLQIGSTIHCFYNTTIMTTTLCSLRHGGYFDNVASIAPVATIALLIPIIASAAHHRHIEKCHYAMTDICLDGIVDPAPTQPAFVVKIGERICEPKLGAICFWGIAGIMACVFRNCWCNALIAVCGRVGKLLPLHTTPGALEAVEGKWRDTTPGFMQVLSAIEVPCQINAMQFEKWAARFPAQRRRGLLAIGAHPDAFPLIANGFPKREITMKPVENPTFKDPRWIRGCPLELSASVGPHLVPWVKEVRDAFMPDYTIEGMRKGKRIVYTCGLSAVDIGYHFGRCIEFVESHMAPDDELIVFEDDQSRFDLHLTKGPFDMLEHVYRKYLPRRVCRLLKRGLSRCVSQHGMRCTVPYTMQSGWPDTSIGDTLVNMCMKLAVHKDKLWLAIVCGDDSVTVTTRRALRELGWVDGIVKAYAEFGMEIEAIVREDIMAVEFCSGRFFPVGDTYVLMPRTGKLLAKICWDMMARPLGQRVLWLRSIATTLRHYGYIDPLMLALSDMLFHHVGQGEKLDTEDEYKYYIPEATKLRSSRQDVVNYFGFHYNLSSDDITDLERVIRASSLGVFCSDPRLVEMAKQDI